MMQQREQDHRNWLKELEASVSERRRFPLTTDPHKCAFGKWYDKYRSEDAWVAAMLKKFDKPHQQIHAVAIDVERCKANGEFDQAERLVDQTRNGVLAAMIKLFAELRDLVRNQQREIAVVLSHNDRLFAVTVEQAQSIEKLPPGSIEEVSSLVRPAAMAWCVGWRARRKATSFL